MSVHRTRKNKERANHGFLVSWEPQASHVKGESGLTQKNIKTKPANTKNANLLVKDDESAQIKRNIYRSLVIVSIILILEVVVYLAWNKFGR